MFDWEWIRRVMVFSNFRLTRLCYSNRCNGSVVMPKHPEEKLMTQLEQQRQEPEQQRKEPTQILKEQSEQLKELVRS
jgi:hypothetical protein